MEDYKERYDDVLKKLTNFIKRWDGVEAADSELVLKELRGILPELKESDDERIRKALLALIEWSKSYAASGITTDEAKEMITWLERQGEQMLDGTFINVYDVREDFVNEVHRVLSSDYDNDRANQIIGAFDSLPTLKLEKQGEQKPTDEEMKTILQTEYEKGRADVIAEMQKPVDKVEPKFHEGDWAVSDLDKMTRYISEVHNDKYNNYYVIKGDVEMEYDINEYDRLHHLWTIQDAKDGDVLFQDLMGGKTFIYNGVNPDMAILYSFIISNDGEDVLPYHIGKPNTGIGNIEENKNIIHPATKEQHDLLFQKMREVGYEWNAESRKLKKIEQNPTDEEMKTILQTEYEKGRADAIAEMQKPAWSEEDEYVFDKIINWAALVNSTSSMFEKLPKQQFIETFKSIKDRVQPKPKQEWSEEDERMIERCIDIFEKILKSSYVYAYTEDCLSWFKSLKDRVQPKSTWKPSDEQMEALEDAIIDAVGLKAKSVLESLHSDLKILKEY